MSHVTVTLPSGHVYTPRFVHGVDEARCIGCGRCYKICGQDVLVLAGINAAGAQVPPDDDDEDECDRKVMTVARPRQCIGCEACARTCTKKAFRHAPLARDPVP